MNDPSWTEVLSADSSLWAAIFAGLTFLATVGAVIVAGFALRWARQAAIEAGKQAEAATDALEWSRKAAQAAQDQIKVLEKQIELSEPQPVVIFRLMFTGWVNTSGWSLEVENLGEELAFDVEIRPLYVGLEGVAKAFMLSFERFPVLKRAETRGYVCTVDPPIQSLNEMPPLSQPQRFLQLFLMGAERDARGKGFAGVKNICIDTVTLNYKNARGRQFEKKFDLWMREFARLEALPRGSLVSEAESAGT